MYLKNVVGFVPQDGAWLTIDGCLRLGFEDRPNGRFWRAPCKGGAFQWVQVPPGNRSSRKQPEQSWR